MLDKNAFTVLQGRHQRGPVVPGLPILYVCPHFMFGPRLLHTSNILFKNVPPPCGFWPPCCENLLTGLQWSRFYLLKYCIIKLTCLLLSRWYPLCWYFVNPQISKKACFLQKYHLLTMKTSLCQLSVHQPKNMVWYISENLKSRLIPLEKNTKTSRYLAKIPVDFRFICLKRNIVTLA